MKIAESKSSGTLVISLSGRLDTLAAEEAQKVFQSALQRGEKWMIVDLQGVDYICSAGLGAFISLTKQAKAAGGQARLCAPRNLIRQFFDVTGVSFRVDLFATRADALAGFPPT